MDRCSQYCPQYCRRTVINVGYRRGSSREKGRLQCRRLDCPSAFFPFGTIRICYLLLLAVEVLLALAVVLLVVMTPSTGGHDINCAFSTVYMVAVSL
jgi:hypothetical protein